MVLDIISGMNDDIYLGRRSISECQDLTRRRVGIVPMYIVNVEPTNSVYRCNTAL